MAPFWCMQITQGPENWVVMVFGHEIANGRVGEPVGVALLVVEVDNGPF